MKILIILLSSISFMQMSAAKSNHLHTCEGFVPKNSRSIPVGTKSGFFGMATGITESEFNSALNRIEKKYAPEISKLGKKLVVNRLWASAEVNAFAERIGDEWHIEMHGGLARHPLITHDGFALVACHEMGHHLGGTPHYDFMQEPLSAEGQADYFATLKCFRRLFSPKENSEWFKKTAVHEKAKTQCQSRHNNPASRIACMRAAHAGINLGMVLAELNEEAEPDLKINDPQVVTQTYLFHPKAQCRLDTYFNGAVCNRTVTEKVSETDYRSGTCERVDGFDFGFRPRCWFKPTDADPLLLGQVNH